MDHGKQHGVLRTRRAKARYRLAWPVPCLAFSSYETCSLVPNSKDLRCGSAVLMPLL